MPLPLGRLIPGALIIADGIREAGGPGPKIESQPRVGIRALRGFRAVVAG